VQVIADPAGRLVWISPALPGARHDMAPPASTESSMPSRRPVFGRPPTAPTRAAGRRSGFPSADAPLRCRHRALPASVAQSEGVSMIASSRRSCRGGCFDGEGAAVADQGPNQVNQAAGERDQSLDMPLSFGSLALVERPRRAVLAFHRRQCGQVEHSAQCAVVALWTAQVALHAARVTGDRGEAGVGSQSVRGAERGEQVRHRCGRAVPRQEPARTHRCW
jgi:hypothetical protein